MRPPTPTIRKLPASHAPETLLFALTHSWWTWDHVKVTAALRGAFLQHWVPFVSERLRENATAGRHPASWEALCGPPIIRRNLRNLKRLKQGAYDSSDGFLL